MRKVSLGEVAQEDVKDLFVIQKLLEIDRVILTLLNMFVIHRKEGILKNIQHVLLFLVKKSYLFAGV